MIEGLEVAIAALVEKVTICEIYAEMYCRASLGSKLLLKLDTALPELYAAVIVFKVKARDYFEAGGVYIERIFTTIFAELQLGWKKFSITFKSFDIEFLPFIKEINAKEEVIRECADAVTMDRVRSMLFLSPHPPFYPAFPHTTQNLMHACRS